jgi:hypothetical protein
MIKKMPIVQYYFFLLFQDILRWGVRLASLTSISQNTDVTTVTSHLMAFLYMVVTNALQYEYFYLKPLLEGQISWVVLPPQLASKRNFARWKKTAFGPQGQATYWFNNLICI